MIDSVRYFSENYNRITVYTILVYSIKQTRLTLEMTTANYHDISKRENFEWPEYLPLCENTHISFIIIHDGCRCQKKIGVIGSKNQSIFRQCSWH